MLSALVHAGALEAYAAHPPPFAVDRACFPPGANLLPLPTPLGPARWALGAAGVGDATGAPHALDGERVHAPALPLCSSQAGPMVWGAGMAAVVTYQVEPCVPKRIESFLTVIIERIFLSGRAVEHRERDRAARGRARRTPRLACAVPLIHLDQYGD